MTAPLLDDPFEREHPIVKDRDASVAFSPRALEVPADELVRWFGVELAAAVPRELASVSEEFPAHTDGDVKLAARFFAIGTALGILTEVDEPGGEHRVLEVLGVKGDLRARLNVTRVRARAAAAAHGTADDPGPEPLLGNVRAWGGEPGQADRAIASVLGHLRLLGLDPQPGARRAEPAFVPPAAERVACDVDAKDAKVLAALVDLLRTLPARGAQARPPRRVAEWDERRKTPDGGLVALRHELHRIGTGVLHARRREVEAGSERPALVRTWNVAGLLGGTRVRIRDVGGRGTVELGGSREGVSAALAFLADRIEIKP